MLNKIASDRAITSFDILSRHGRMPSGPGALLLWRSPIRSFTSATVTAENVVRSSDLAGPIGSL